MIKWMDLARKAVDELVAIRELLTQLLETSRERR